MIVYDMANSAGGSSDLPGAAPADQSSPQSSPAQSSSSGLSGIASGVAVDGVKAGVGYGVSQTSLSGVPGVAGAINSGIGAAFNDATAADIGVAALTGGLTSEAISGLSGLGVPGAVSSTGFNLAKEGFRDNPNYGRALTSSAVPGIVGTVTGILAGPVAGYMAGTLAGYATEHSLLDGHLGDMTDSRSREKDRDIAEDHGYSVSDTKSMTRADAFGDLPGAFGFGLTDAVNATTTGNIAEAASLTDTVAEGLMSQAATNALGDPASLTSFADKLGLMEAAPVAAKTGFTGDPFGHSAQEGYGDIAANIGIGVGAVNGASAPESPMGWDDVAAALGLIDTPEEGSLLGKAQKDGDFDSGVSDGGNGQGEGPSGGGMGGGIGGGLGGTSDAGGTGASGFA